MGSARPGARRRALPRVERASGQTRRTRVGVGAREVLYEAPTAGLLGVHVRELRGISKGPEAQADEANRPGSHGLSQGIAQDHTDSAKGSPRITRTQPRDRPGSHGLSQGIAQDHTDSAKGRGRDQTLSLLVPKRALYPHISSQVTRIPELYPEVSGVRVTLNSVDTRHQIVFTSLPLIIILSLTPPFSWSPPCGEWG
ncbi:hypothetical protein NDU88_004156 [Pleurodeles waltl]|uniref:Uncharacterized protein n=1 Tax=Pleurodeles waltl TaxID=8319 RepID=A0AAV7V254_PLEWA|nr:hypothetical protein NDU88_004156 [Pleurodeles waltl]